MKRSVVTFILLFGWLPTQASGQQKWAVCQGYANLANSHDRSQLDKSYEPLEKGFVERAIYAERLYAFQAEDRDSILLDNLPKNGKELQDFYKSVDCARDLPHPVAHIEALAASFSAYFIDASRAVVRRPEYMQQFVRMYTQFNSTPVDNVDLSEQICPIGVYVYLHRKAELLAALPAAKATPKDIPHKYDECP
jgi:hypothetical protein